MIELGHDIIRDVIEWDVLTWQYALSFWKKRMPAELKGKTVLCLGERKGGVSLWFALQGLNVVCSDFGGVGDSAYRLHQKYGVQVIYRDVNVFSIPFPENYFDFVSCKSVMGGLKEVYSDKNTRSLVNQKKAANEILRVLKPNGCFLGAENVVGSFLHEMLRKKMKGARIGWRHPSFSELKFMFSDFKQLEVEGYGFIGSHYHWRWINTIGSVLDRLLVKIIPMNWTYVGFIFCRKA